MTPQESHRSKATPTRVGLGLLFAVCVGCTGSIGTHGSNPGAGAGIGTGTGSSTGAGGAGASSNPGVYVPASPSLRLLTVSQYQNSVRALLGDAITLPADLELDTVLNGFVSIGASKVDLSPLAVEQFEAAALAVGQAGALRYTATRGALVGCTPGGDDRRRVRAQLHHAVRSPRLAPPADRRRGDALRRRSPRRREHDAEELLRRPGVRSGRPAAVAALHLPRRARRARSRRTRSRRVFERLRARDAPVVSSCGTRRPTTRCSTPPSAASWRRRTASQRRRSGCWTRRRARGAMQSFFGELLPSGGARQPDPAARRSSRRMTHDAGRLDARRRRCACSTTSPSARRRLPRPLRHADDVRERRARQALRPRRRRPGRPSCATTLPATGPRAGLLGQASFLAMNSHPNATLAHPARQVHARGVAVPAVDPAAPPDVEPPFPPRRTAPRTTRQKLAVAPPATRVRGCHWLHGSDRARARELRRHRRLPHDGRRPDDRRQRRARRRGVHRRRAGSASRSRTTPTLRHLPGARLFRYALGHLETAGESGHHHRARRQAFTDGNYRFKALLLDSVASQRGLPLRRQAE